MISEKIVAAVLLASLMFHTGLLVNRDHLRAVLADRGLLGRAFLANFILVPVFGVLLTRAFRLSDPIATGILLMAISPGVPFVVLSGGRKKGGSLGLAVSLAFLMPALSIITVPITAHFVLPGTAVSTASIVVSLFVFQLIPLLLGIWVTERAPEISTRLQRLFALISLAMLLVLVALLAQHVVASITTEYGSRGMMASLTIVLLSLLTGWLLGGTDRAYRWTLGVGTALRNVGLASVIATTTFGRSEVGATVLVYFVIQFVTTTVIGAVFSRVTKGPQLAAR